MEVVNGGWSQWSPWTPCTATCGGGFKHRSRLCNNPVPKNGGAQCVGKSERKKKCGRKPCRRSNTLLFASGLASGCLFIIVFSGLWTPWTEWSSCSVTCGNGTRSRERFCTNSQQCLGSNPKQEIGGCKQLPCIGEVTCKSNCLCHHDLMFSALVNLCDKSPCENGGSCLPLNGGKNFKCYCKLGFYGNHCESKRNVQSQQNCSTTVFLQS